MVAVVGKVVGGGGGVGGGVTVVGAVVVLLVEVAVLGRAVGAVVLGSAVVVLDAVVLLVVEDGAGVESFESLTRKAMATPAPAATNSSSAASSSGSGTGRRRGRPGLPRGITRVGASLNVVGCSPDESARTSASPSGGRASGSFASDASAKAAS